MTIKERTIESEYNNISDSKMNKNDTSKNSFTKSKRKVRFNSFSDSISNPLYKKEERNSILFKNYFDDAFDNLETEDVDTTRTENGINYKNDFNNNPNDFSIVLNLSQDKILFNNLQYDSMFIHDIDPFKDKDTSKKNNKEDNFHNNILDELKEEEEKENREKKNKYNDYFNEKPPSYFDSSKMEKQAKNKKASVKFDENQINNYKKSSKKGKKNEKKKGNDTTRELLKNKFLKFVKRYASNSKNYSLSDDVEIEKSFYNFYDENFGKNGIDFDANICTYEKHDGSRYNVTVNDLFDNRSEFDEFKNSIYIERDNSDDNTIESTATSSSSKTNGSTKRNTSFQYNSSFVYDHNSFGPDYEDTMNYLCYNISTCIDEDIILDDEEKNKKMNENILSGLFDDEDEVEENNINNNNQELITTKKPDSVKDKNKNKEKSKLKENLKMFMESEAFKKMINDPDTFTVFLKSILNGYVDPKKIDKTKDKLFKMIDNKEIEQIKKFVGDYIDIVEESEDKIKDMREKSIMIETEKNNGVPSTELIESNPGFIARFNDIMIEKFTNINNAIINFTTELCPQIIKNGLNSIMKSIPFVVSFASLIPMEYVTGLLSSFPAGQAILNAVNDVIFKSSLFTSSHMALPQIAIIIGCLYKNFCSRSNDDDSRGVNNENTFMTKFLSLFEIFSNHLRSDGGLNNTEKDPSAITNKVINAAFKTMMESKDLPSVFSNDKINTIVTNLMDNLPNSDNKLKSCLSVLNEVMNKENVTSKALIDELINILDNKKLNDEDVSRIISLIIQGSQNIPSIMSSNEQNSNQCPTKNNLIEDSVSTTLKNYYGFNDNSFDADKSYSVIMLSQVIDELKKPNDGLAPIQENPLESIHNRNIQNNGKIIHEFKKGQESLNPDRKIKMKPAYDKRSFSLIDMEKRKLYEKNPHSEFIIKKKNSINNNAEFSIRRGEFKNPTEQIIPKYTSSVSPFPSTSPVYFQRRRYNSYDDNFHLAPKQLFNIEKKNDAFQNLIMKNEWEDDNDKETKDKKYKENFTIESKGLNIGNSFINDDLFTAHDKEKLTDNDKKQSYNNAILSELKDMPIYSEGIDEESTAFNDQDRNKEIKPKKNHTSTEYSINSDDTYDRLFLSNDLSVASDSSYSSINESKNSKKSKDKSFRQRIMRRLRSGSKRINKPPKNFEWENLPMEILFNIFKNFSIQELAKLREVSRYFNYILTNPIFYMNINLTNESDTADNEMLFYQLKYSNGYLLSLNLSQCNLINENVFKDSINYKVHNRKINNNIENERINLCFNDNNNIISKKEESLVQNLRDLDLSYCSGIYSSNDMCNFFRGFSIQPNGTIIKKNGCINLEELNLSDLYQILSDDLLLSIADSCPKLKKLYISKGYDITNYSIKMILRKCKNLESLKLVNCPNINYEAFDTRCIEEISILSENVSYDLKLKYLNVSYCRMMEVNLIKMVADHCPYLEELYISGCQNISDEGMTHLVSGRAWKNKRVKVLDISGCYCIGDKGIKAITPSVLEKLDISDCSFITDSGLQYIFDGMPLLKEIGYENCSGTSSIGRDKLLSKYSILSKTE
ncbi:hypothetical protein BCR32DRAFT_298231 [Anaeromyces robustus]|uniref:F-box domain-containing protein n=1 Tax=Anaeromyces robustus TaxID=1754192 RepID=A0A1Y1VRZ2_9FUNG|nr:hypothetical protein BCR32DRAFT_298231 [Anaeromyces robustus]|eukprot:ORX64049.1 hypothetical protein BCR32DRAFT_298231 [Anaeromyces robustus]